MLARTTNITGKLSTRRSYNFFSIIRFPEPLSRAASPDLAPTTVCTRIARWRSRKIFPMKIEFMETAEKVNELLPKLHEMVGTGLIEIQDTTIVKPSEASAKGASQEDVPALKRQGKAKLMRIFIGANDKWNGQPLHKALLESMRANDIAGATVYQGILGYGANRRIHKDSALHLSHDRPIMLSVVDTEERLRTFLPVLDGMVQQGLVVFSDVDVIKYTRDFQEVERRKEARK